MLTDMETWFDPDEILKGLAHVAVVEASKGRPLSEDEWCVVMAQSMTVEHRPLTPERFIQIQEMLDILPEAE